LAYARDELIRGTTLIDDNNHPLISYNVTTGKLIALQQQVQLYFLLARINR
jgi:hypothetical protein